MGSQHNVKEGSNKENINKVTIIGNINAKNIEIDKEKGIAKFSIAMSNAKDKEPQWYNLSYFLKKEGEDKMLNTLEKIEKEGKGIQVSLASNVGYSVDEKDGEKQYYTNLTAYAMEPTKDFKLPKAIIELTGTLFNELEIKKVEKLNHLTGKKEKVELGSISIKTVEGKDNNIIKYHNLNTTNKDNIDFLKNLKKGEDISIKNVRLGGKGYMNIAKDSIIKTGKDFATTNIVITKNQEQTKDR